MKANYVVKRDEKKKTRKRSTKTNVPKIVENPNYKNETTEEQVDMKETTK